MRLIRVALVMTVVAAARAAAGEPLAYLPQDAREELADFARQVLAGKVQRYTPATLVRMSPALRALRPEELFITISRDRAPTVRFGSERNGIVEAVFAAMTKARTLPSFDFYDYAGTDRVSLYFERVVERHTIPPNRWVAELAFLNLGVHGIAISHGTRSGTLPPADVLMKRLDDRDAFVNQLCTALKVYPRTPKVASPDAERWDKARTRVELLSFETFLSRGPDYPAVQLYRLNDLAAPPWTDRLDVARRMGDVLLRYQDDDGWFFHRYDFEHGGYLPAPYNIVHHCYAIVTLADLSVATGDRRYLDAAGKAVTYLKKKFTMHTPAKGKPFVFVEYNKKAKLGSAAMAVVALDRYAELTGSVFHDGDMKLLGTFLLHQQYDDGSFLHYYRYDKDVPYEYRISSTYPGQAAWALAVLARRFNDDVWRTAAHKAADYLIKRREKEMRWTEPPADVWFAAALHEMCTPFAQESHLEYGKRMADHVARQQRVTDVPPDLVGSFLGETEGSVRGAARRTRLLGEVATFTVQTPADREMTLEVMRRAMTFVRLNELRPNNAFYLDEPEGAYGMVRASSFENDVRLDTTCHVIQAILWLERMEKRGE